MSASPTVPAMVGPPGWYATSSAAAASSPVLLYCHPSMRGLARRLADECAAAEARAHAERMASFVASFGPSSTTAATAVGTTTATAGSGESNNRSSSSSSSTGDGAHRTVSSSSPSSVPSAAATPLPRTLQFREEDIRWETFEDGFPNLFIDRVKDLAGRHVIFLASFYPVANIYEQLAILYQLPRYLARSLTVILPYFPTGTMERIDHEGQIPTATTTCKLLSAIPLTALGPPQVVVYDIHSLASRLQFAESVVPRLDTAVPLLLDRLKTLPEEQKAALAIAFPDEGACKRFGRAFPKQYSVITCIKVRGPDGARHVTIKEGVPDGKHVVIVDDLVKTGGTLINCAKALRDAGAKSVSAYCTHAVFPQQSWRRFTDGLFEKFWVTDSCPSTIKELEGKAPFEVLSLSKCLAELLMVDLTR